MITSGHAPMVTAMVNTGTEALGMTRRPCARRGRRAEDARLGPAFAGLDVAHNAAEISAWYCAWERGTTESRPWRSRGESANKGLSLIWGRVTG